MVLDIPLNLRIDSHKIHFHPKRVSQWLENKDDWERAKSLYPIYVEISPVGACNHSCVFCGVDMMLESARRSKNIPQLDAAILKDRLSEMAGLGVKSAMMAGSGEPFLHKDIVSVCETANKAGMDISFTTNGVLLKPDALAVSSWIKVSLNAGSPETYAKIHRTKEKDFVRVWGNIWRAVRAREETGAKCTLGVQSVLLPENISEMVDLAKMCRDAGVDYFVVKPYSQAIYSINRMQIDYSKYQSLDNDLSGLNTEKFSVVFRAETMKAVNEEIPYSKCRATPYMWGYVEANGDVYTCSAYLSDKRFIVGNINSQSFKDIWEGEGRHKNWELMKTLDIHQCRKGCRMHSVNLYLWDLENAEHRNFI